jgi:hypothetical protein
MGLINFRRAMLACRNSGYKVTDHFAEVSKTIELITLNYAHPLVEKKCKVYLSTQIIINECRLVKKLFDSSGVKCL